jgi:hypothetical protein
MLYQSYSPYFLLILYSVLVVFVLLLRCTVMFALCLLQLLLQGLYEFHFFGDFCFVVRDEC